MKRVTWQAHRLTAPFPQGGGLGRGSQIRRLICDFHLPHPNPLPEGEGAEPASRVAQT